MRDKRIDYSEISERFDETRVPLIQSTLEPCVSKIADYSGILASSMVLDVGCGTGIYTIPLAKRTGTTVLGLDASKEMIRKAKTKQSREEIEWLVGDAENLPFSNCQFDCVYMTLVIHQIVNKKRAIEEIHRVLKKSGRFVAMTKSHGQLRRALITSFPKARHIDLERFPTIPALKSTLISAGFQNAKYHVVHGGVTRVSVEDYLDRVRKRFISTLALLSEEDFKRGYVVFERKLRGQATANEVSYEKEYTFVNAEKEQD